MNKAYITTVISSLISMMITIMSQKFLTMLEGGVFVFVISLLIFFILTINIALTWVIFKDEDRVKKERKHIKKMDNPGKWK